MLFAAACAVPSVQQPGSLKRDVVATQPPACLSVQESDRHVEFNGVELVLAESGPPVPLKLENGETVACEKLEIIRKAKSPVVFIRFRTLHKNLSVTMIAVASIRDARWVIAPVVIQRRKSDGDNSSVETPAEYKLSEDQDTAVITIKDLAKKTSRKIQL